MQHDDSRDCRKIGPCNFLKPKAKTTTTTPFSALSLALSVSNLSAFSHNHLNVSRFLSPTHLQPLMALHPHEIVIRERTHTQSHFFFMAFSCTQMLSVFLYVSLWSKQKKTGDAKRSEYTTIGTYRIAESHVTGRALDGEGSRDKDESENYMELPNNDQTSLSSSQHTWRLIDAPLRRSDMSSCKNR